MMRRWRGLGKRALASFLSFTMCLSMVNLAAFAVGEDYDMETPLPQADPESGIAYPMEYPGYGEFLLTEYPKTGEEVPAGGVWAVEGAWEDGAAVLSIDPEGNAVIFEPTGAEALVTVTYTYQKAVEKAPIRVPVQVVEPVEPEAEPTTPVGEESAAPEAEETPASAETGEPETEESGEPAPAESLPVQEEEPQGPETQTPEDREPVAGEPVALPETEGQPVEDGEQVPGDVTVEDNEVPRTEAPEILEEEPGEDEVAVEGGDDAPEADEAAAEDGTVVPGADEAIVEEGTDTTAADEAAADDSEGGPVVELVDVVLRWRVLFTSEVNLLAGGSYCDDPKYPLDKVKDSDGVFRRKDGNHLIMIDGTWKGALEFGGNYTVTIRGNGTIDATGMNRSAITVNPGCTVILEGNVTVKGGSGQYVDSWPQYNSDGTLRSYGHTVGGGVCVNAVKEAGGTFIMRADEDGKAPTISNNSAGAGGGIYVGNFSWEDDNGTKHQKNAELYIYAGTIDNNRATGVRRLRNIAGGMDCGGGGLWINGKAEIDPTKDRGGDIKITNNSSATKVDLGGGGIYVNNPGSLSLVNAIITENHADGLGGGVASCVHGKVSIVNINNNGAAVYSNTTNKTAYDENTAADDAGRWTYNTDEPTIGNFVDAHTQWRGDETAKVNFRNAATDIFCAGAATDGGGTIISDTRPVNSSAKWTGYVMNAWNGSFEEITAANNGYIYGGFLLGLTAGNTEKPTFETNGTLKANTVTISGNTSATHGGGIATNGVLALSYVPGSSVREESSNRLNGAVPLTVNKELKGADINKNNFTFELVDTNGNVVDTATTVNGKATLSYEKKPNGTYGIDATKLNGNQTFVFYVREVASSDAEDNNTVYKVAVSVTKGKVETETVEAAKLKVTINHYNVGTVTYERGTGVGNAFKSLASNCAGINYTKEVDSANVWKTGSLRLNKSLSGNVPSTDGKTFTFRVTLSDNTGKGLDIKNKTFGDVAFGADGVGTVSVTAGTPVTISGIPAGAHYKVEEINAPGVWTASGAVEGDIVADAIKEATITNTRAVASLTVGKMVTVNTPSSEDFDHEKTFEIKVTLGTGLNAEGNENTVTGTDYVENGVYTFRLKHGAMATITGIPTGTTYTVTESRDGLVTSGDGYRYVGGEVTSTLATNTTETITNHYYKAKFIKKTIEKTWFDSGEHIPESIVVKLIGGPDTLPEETRVVTLTAPWTYTWESLPMYAGDGGALYRYTVEEVSVKYPEAGSEYEADERDGNVIRVRRADSEVAEGGKEIVGGWVVSDGNNTITNTWRPAMELGDTSFTVHKVDSETRENIGEAVFTLTKEGETVDVQTTDEDGLATFGNLTKGTYVLQETSAAPGYRTDDESRNLTRTWEIEIKKDGLVKVEAVNEGLLEQLFVGKNTWNWKPSHADMALDGENHTGTLTITNQIIKGKISVAKELDLDGETVEMKDVKFLFAIYEGGTPDLELDEPLETLWVSADGKAVETKKEYRYGTYTVVELPDMTVPEDSDLANYDWTNVEITNDGVVDVTEQGATVAVTATNSYTRHTGDLELMKTVSGNLGETERAWTFGVRLTAPAGYVKLQSGEGTYPAAIFTPQRDERGNFLKDDKGGFLYEAAPGWEGTVAFGSTLAVEEAEAQPLAEAEPPAEGEGGERVPPATVPATPITPIAGNGSTFFFQVKLSHGQKLVLKDVPVGTTYEVVEGPEAEKDGYRVTAKGEKGAIPVQKDGEAQTAHVAFDNYRHSSGPSYTNLSVRKVWRNDTEEVRPTSIRVNLMLGSRVSETVTLSEDNGWSHTWQNLVVGNDWSVAEAEIPEGYIAEVTRSGTSYTITNTYTSTTPTPTPTPSSTPEPSSTPTPYEEEELLEDEVPLGNSPFSDDTEEVFEELLEDEVPLANVPQTGDGLCQWLITASVSGLGLAVLSRRRKEEEEG